MWLFLVAHVEDVGRVDVDREIGFPNLGGVRMLDRGLPALRIGEEELDRSRVGGGRRGQRIG